MNFQQAVEMWCVFQRDALNRSELTIKNYVSDVMQFARHFGLETVDITRQEAEGYVHWMAKEGLAASSRSRKISAIQTFYRWLLDNGLISDNPTTRMVKPKIPQKKVLAMSQDEVKQVIDAAKAMTESSHYHRNIVLLMLLFGTGLRRNEVVNVKVNDIDLEENSLLVAEGKGNKQRIVYFNDSCKQELALFIENDLEMYPYSNESEYLFQSFKSGKLNVTSVNRIVNGVFEAAGLKDKGYTLHSTRKSFATSVYGATKDIAVTQQLLGHSSPQTTMRYVGVNESNKRNAAQTINFF